MRWSSVRALITLVSGLVGMCSWNTISGCPESCFVLKMPNIFFFPFNPFSSSLFLLYSSSCMHKMYFSLIPFKNISGRTNYFWRVSVDFILANLLYWALLRKGRFSPDSKFCISRTWEWGIELWGETGGSPHDQPGLTHRSETVSKDAHCFSDTNLCVLGLGLSFPSSPGHRCTVRFWQEGSLASVCTGLGRTRAVHSCAGVSLPWRPLLL